MRKALLCMSVSLPLLAVSACNRQQETAQVETPATATPTTPTPATQPRAGIMLDANATDADKIASAMRAAPSNISQNATIFEMNADGTMRELRKGTNAFSCMPDNPATPGPDPMCGDANGMEFVHAYLAKRTPPANKVGLLYMLEGGTDASNTDPFATEPTATNNWIKTGPHLMIVGAAKQMAGYPRDAAPDTSMPYVMWPNTPYEHLMVPVPAPMG